ncbi:MAG TPA: hypothetical protein VM689_15695 [Aliidongia sp.]|nr:hypothetical protein [Aliidongia sp.]
MPPKKNPLALNSLQLKTLTLLQHLAQQPGFGTSTDEGVELSELPHAHGDHFHLGSAVVASRDATGLANEGVWVALDRKGLIKSGFPHSVVVTKLGLDYDTGLADEILHRADH